MKIGVKYCGGCNPHYDRKKLMDSLQQEFPAIELVSANGQGPFDIVAVVCGCESRCVQHEALQGKLGKVILACDADYETLRRVVANHINVNEE